MRYNYTQMNEIIEKQYAKKKDSNSNWLLEESIKYGKGYSTTGEYLQVIANKIVSKSDVSNTIDAAIYIEND